MRYTKSVEFFMCELMVPCNVFRIPTMQFPGLGVGGWPSMGFSALVFNDGMFNDSESNAGRSLNRV